MVPWLKKIRHVAVPCAGLAWLLFLPACQSKIQVAKVQGQRTNATVPCDPARGEVADSTGGCVSSTTTTQPAAESPPVMGNMLHTQSRGSFRFLLNPGQTAEIGKLDLFSDTSAKWLAHGLAFDTGDTVSLTWSPVLALREGLLPWGSSDISIHDSDGRIMQIHNVMVHDFAVFGPAVATFSGAKQSGHSQSGHTLQAWVPLTFGEVAEAESHISVDWQHMVND